MNISMNSGRVVIDGKEFQGKNVSIRNGKIIIDGKTQDGELTGDVNVVVHGNVQSLENHSGNVTAQDVGEVSTGSGDVYCSSVGGSVRTGSGDVSCGDVGGNIRTGSGDVMHKQGIK